jgi:hypothetical protein
MPSPSRRRILVLDASKLRDALTSAPSRGPLFLESLDEIMENPVAWANFSEHDTQQVLIGLYLQRRRRMQ